MKMVRGWKEHYKMHSQLIWFWNKACTGWIATTHWSIQALFCPVRPAAKLVEAPDFEESLLSHDAGLRSEEFRKPVALDGGEAQRDTVL